MGKDSGGSRSAGVSPIEKRTINHTNIYASPPKNHTYNNFYKISPQFPSTKHSEKSFQKSLESICAVSTPTIDLKNGYLPNPRTTSTPFNADDSGLTDSLGDLRITDLKSPPSIRNGSKISRKPNYNFSPDAQFRAKKSCLRLSQGPIPKFSLDEPDFSLRNSSKGSPAHHRKHHCSTQQQTPKRIDCIHQTSQISNQSADSAFHEDSNISSILVSEKNHYQFDHECDSLANFSDLHASIDNFCESLNQSLSVKDISLLIGRRMGLEKLDILSELSYSKMHHVISNIFKYLTPSDLYSTCQVSPEWKDICKQDVNAKRRRKEYIKKLQINKENGRKVIDSLMKTKRANKKETNYKLATSQEFWEANKRLKSYEKMIKCPKCLGPAAKNEIYEKGKCFRHSCSHKFCTKCNSTYHFAMPCTKFDTITGKNSSMAFSKKSKRLLDRL